MQCNKYIIAQRVLCTVSCYVFVPTLLFSCKRACDMSEKNYLLTMANLVCCHVSGIVIENRIEQQETADTLCYSPRTEAVILRDWELVAYLSMT